MDISPGEAAGRWKRLAVLAAASLPPAWGGYLLLVYPPTPVEYAVGLAVALITAAGVAGTAAVVTRRWAWPGGVAATLALLPWRVARGYVRVVSAGLAVGPWRIGGELHRERSPGIGRSDDAEAAGRRAWTGWARSLAADELVAGFHGSNDVLVHVLPARKQPKGGEG